MPATKSRLRIRCKTLPQPAAQHIWRWHHSTKSLQGKDDNGPRESNRFHFPNQRLKQLNQPSRPERDAPLTDEDCRTPAARPQEVVYHPEQRRVYRFGRTAHQTEPEQIVRKLALRLG